LARPAFELTFYGDGIGDIWVTHPLRRRFAPPQDEDIRLFYLNKKAAQMGRFSFV
jgi:hypothetical protein